MLNWEKSQENIVGQKYISSNFQDLKLEIRSVKHKQPYTQYYHNDSYSLNTIHTLTIYNKDGNILFCDSFYQDLRKVKKFAENEVISCVH